MSKLAAALAWAARGFPVFPLHPNGKRPIWDTWLGAATTNPEIVRQYWTDPVLKIELDYNIGVDCTDRVVVDIDVKDGKDGYNEYIKLGGTFDTLTVRTPTGGYHLYFEGPDSANVALAIGVDIRSHNGYVIAPGSAIEGKPYTIEREGDPAWIPAAVAERLQAPYVRSEAGATVELDSPANVQAGIGFLGTAPIAIQGQNGDDTTFQVAARLVREIALSTQTAFELMRDHWNERCLPPWPLDELFRKVENATAYGTAELGRLDPTVVFAATAGIEPPPGPLAQAGLLFGLRRVPGEMKPRPWLLDGLLMTGKLTVVGSGGSAGKSTLSLTIAAFGAHGRDFAGRKMHRKFKTFIYNGEDDVDEQERRLLAICRTYGFDYEYVRSMVILTSYEELSVAFVTSTRNGVQTNQPLVADFMKLFSDPEIGLGIFDPLVDTHYGDESDPVHMNAVMLTLQILAKASDVALLLPHHTTKGGGADSRQEDRIGNVDIFRGSTAIVNKCRIALTLLDASNKDVEEYGLQDGERHAWVRLDDAKTQFTLKGSQKTIWFNRVGVKIETGDVVGVLQQHDLTKNVMHMRIRVADILIGTLEAMGQGSMPIAQAVNSIKAQEPIYSNRSDTDVRKMLEGMFQLPIEIRGKTLQVKRPTTDEGKSGPIVVTLS